MDQYLNNNKQKTNKESMNLQGEYVYVIEESIKSGERVYKVGESTHILHTMSLYAKGSQLRMLVNVSNS